MHGTGSLAPVRKRSPVARGVPDDIFVSLLAIFLARRNLSWAEGAVRLHSQVHIAYSPRQVKVACVSRGYTRKQLTLVAVQRSEMLRRVYRHVTRPRDQGGLFNANQFCFVDETLKCGRDSMRDTGVAFRGERASARVDKHLQKQRVGAIVSITAKGVGIVRKVDTEEMSINSDMFMAVLQYDILPTMNAFAVDVPNSILVLDNSRLHDKTRIHHLCAVRGILVFFLPPYSPDMNPIELLFNTAKMHMKRVYGLGDNGGMTLSDMFEASLYSCMTPDQFCNTYTHCGYPAGPDDRAWANL